MQFMNMQEKQILAIARESWVGGGEVNMQFLDIPVIKKQ